MSAKKSKKMRHGLRDRINGDANRILRLQIFSLARKRDLLGIAAIVEAVTIIVLTVLLLR